VTDSRKALYFFLAGLLAFIGIVYAGSGTVAVTAVTDNGNGSYALTIADTTGMTVGDQFGAKLASGRGAIYEVMSIPGSTSAVVSDTQTEDEGVAFGAPATGTGWFATPSTNLDLSLPPYQSKGWDAPMRRDNAVLDAVDLFALTRTNSNFIVGDGTDWVAESGATARTSLGVAIGTNVQAWDAQLDDIAALAVTNSNFIVGDGSNWVAESAGTARTSLGLAIGTNVQAWDTQLDDIAALAHTNSNFIVGDGSNWVAETGATARTSLGLTTMATMNPASVAITGGSITGHTTTVTEKTASYTLQTTDSNTAHTNEGTAAVVTFTLPTAAAGLRFDVICQVDSTVAILAGGGDTISHAGFKTKAAGFVRAIGRRATVTVTAINATEWVVTSSSGQWGLAPRSSGQWGFMSASDGSNTYMSGSGFYIQSYDDSDSEGVTSDAYGYYYTASTAASTGAEALVRTGGSGEGCDTQNNPIATVKFALETTTNCRWFCGLTDDADGTMTASDDPTGEHFGLIYSSGRDSNFMFVMDDGTTQQLTDTGVAIDTDVHYIVIDVEDDESCVLRILDAAGNEEASTSHTANLPVAQPMDLIHCVDPTANEVKTIRTYYFSAESRP